MGLDARLRYTRMVIKNSFVELLKKKPVNKITVKEICEMAEINRATFYKHYLDVYDLLDKLEQEFLLELQNNVQQSIEKSFKDTFTLILTGIKADSELYITLFSQNGDPNFPNRIFPLCYEYIAMEQDERFQKLSPSELTWLYYFIAQGCSGILNQWIKNGMTEPINEVTNFTDKLIQNVLAASQSHQQKL